MKPNIENLKVWISGRSTTAYQRALGMREFEQLLAYVAELEKLRQIPDNGSASDFERELHKLINAYVSAGLKKPDLVHKMEYVTQSCRVS